MKRIMFLTMLALLSGVGLFAQKAQGQGRSSQYSAEERAQFTVERMSASVDMTDAQKAELTTIFTKFHTEKKQYMTERNRTKVQELVTSRDAQVKTVLNNETKYNAYLKFLEDQRNRGGKGPNKSGKKTSKV